MLQEASGGSASGRAAGDASGEVVTAALLVIGDEILSGRTKDKNIGHVAETLTGRGIDLSEVRVVPDDEARIVDAVNALRGAYDYLFTTGGIGPTHDDITADCIAKAFGVPIDVDPRAVAMMRERFKPEELNEARLRMARMPQGAELVHNSFNKVPGFWIGNVIVMAGVPAIMQAMLEGVAPRLRVGRKVLSRSVRADMKEGDIGSELRALAGEHAGVSVGSYPFWDDTGVPNTNIVVRSREAGALEAAVAAVEAMLGRMRSGRPA